MQMFEGMGMATYVLVSGAWHAGWCWERVVPLLEAQGHRVVVPDLIGMGPNRAALSAASLEAWADQIATIIREQEEPVILVGHSRGGIVISETAERVPELIATLVYLAAFLVETGNTLLGTSAKVMREPAPDILIVQNDGTTIVRRDAVGPTFYNTTEPSWGERAQSLVTPEPMAVFMTPLDLTKENFGSVKRAYIECIQDNAVPLELQRLMQAALPCAPVFTLDTDHSPFYSAPDQLVTCLDQISVSLT
jgi:pimeloyl-ACP methyl ester carboxylesterase